MKTLIIIFVVTGMLNQLFSSENTIIQRTETDETTKIPQKTFNYGKQIGISPNFGLLKDAWFIGLNVDIRLYKILNIRLSEKLLYYAEVDKYVNWVTGGIFIKGALIQNSVRGYVGLSAGIFAFDKHVWGINPFVSISGALGIETEIIITGSGLMYVFIESGINSGKSVNINNTSVNIGKNVYISAGLIFYF
jgi:hypothetical protein